MCLKALQHLSDHSCLMAHRVLLPLWGLMFLMGQLLLLVHSFHSARQGRLLLLVRWCHSVRLLRLVPRFLMAPPVRLHLLGLMSHLGQLLLWGHSSHLDPRGL